MNARAARRAVAALLAASIAASAAGCALRIAPPSGPRAEALRVSEVVAEGDATRRASLRLVLQGLDEDRGGRAAAARSSYERAIQIDATNPYAYLALARHEIEAERYRRALEALEQAELLFGSEPAPGVEAHLVGLRGAAALGKGYGGEAEPLLARAGEIAPEVWADGYLSAEELR